jgi:hypothetical protein
LGTDQPHSIRKVFFDLFENRAHARRVIAKVSILWLIDGRMVKPGYITGAERISLIRRLVVIGAIEAQADMQGLAAGWRGCVTVFSRSNRQTAPHTALIAVLLEDIAGNFPRVKW